MYRRHFLTGIVAVIVLPHSAVAYSPIPYAPATWRDLRDSADRVVVNFRASWSLTCQIKEDLIREALTDTPEYGSLTFVDVDWDTFGRSNWVQRNLKVERRSTLIAFRNRKEVARLVNEPYDSPIRSFLDTAIKA